MATREQSVDEYVFERGFPTAETAQRAYDDADLNRAIQAYGYAVNLHFGPSAPVGDEGRWIKTIPGRGRFVDLRLYGPEGPAFSGDLRPDDFERVD